MSQLWPELLRVTLCPDQVVLEQGKQVVGMKGAEPRFYAPEIIPVEPRHEPALWTAPLAVLGLTLDGLPERPHDATVILSNHFVRYPLLPADRPCGPGSASGDIDPELEAALREVLEQRNCRLTALQPRLIALGSTFLDEFQGESGWVVLVEEGLAAIGLVQDWEFTRFRSLYMWPASSVKLLTLLDQEAALAGLRRRPRNLVLWQRDETDEVILPFNSGWQITRFGNEPAGPVPYQAAPMELPLSGARV